MSNRIWCGLLAGSLLGFGAGLLSAPVPDPKDGRTPQEIDAARDLLGRIISRAAEPRVDPEQLGRLWQQMLARFAGTPEWKEAAWVMSQAPSLLDRLQRQQIPELDRPSSLPREVVAVLGENHGRRWIGSGHKITASPDGQLLADISGDRVCLFETATLRERATLPIRAQTSAWARRGAVLALGVDNQVQLWDVGGRTVRRLATLKGPDCDVRCLAFLPDGKSLVSYSLQQAIFWDLTGDQPRPRRCHTVQGDEQSDEFEFSPDGMSLIANKGSESCKLWRLAEKANQWPVVMENAACHGCAFSPDSKKLAVPTGGGKATFQLLDLTGPVPKVERVIEYPPEDSFWGRLCFSSDGELLVGTGFHRYIGLLPLTEKKRQQLGLPRGQAYRKYPLAPQFAEGTLLPGDKTLVLSSIDRCIRLFDLETGKERFSRAGHCFAITAAALARDGRTLATGAENGEIRLWDLTAPQQEKAILKRPVEMRKGWDQCPVDDLAFSSDGRSLLTIWECTTESLHIWDLSQANLAKPKAIPMGSSRAMGGCLFSPDGTKVATLGEDQLSLPQQKERGLQSVPAVQLWAWKDGNLQLAQRLAIKNKHLDRDPDVGAGQYSPDGKLLAFRVGVSQIEIWDVQSVPPRHKASITLSAPGQLLAGFTFSADGRQLVTASRDWDDAVQPPYKLRLRWWDLGGEKPIQRKVWVDESNSFGCQLVMSPDGQFLATTNSDAMKYSVDLCIWSVAEGKKIKSWQLPGSCSIRFAPDSRHLLTMNGNGSVYVWRLAEPKARTP